MTNETQKRLTHGIGRRSPREALFDEIMLWKQNQGFPCFPEKNPSKSIHCERKEEINNKEKYVSEHLKTTISV